MRTFIAIEIPSEIKSALAALQTELRRAGADVSWTKPENMHLTLNFLGEVDERRIGEIERACVSSAAEFQPFTLRINDTGVFPNARQPRVLWAGLSGAVENVVEMRRRIDERLAQIGFKRDEKRFNPHLTIGRLKSNKKTRELLALADAHQLPALSFVVTEIVLMKSELHPAGAEYTPIAKASLGDEKNIQD
ncbi:MAG TPA: RNA 2',3'-cyclic phosphodiesterase [Blastocatellia bacterium]|jgi:2'-5' RNA ligase|nr:RNA 2',3'-cyclic phosphodiesterase [Blastocatellia bacterium]